MSVGTEETAYWKERYFTLLNEGEKQQNERNEYESLLSRAIVRLTLAASGLDAALDPHLEAIREVMRKSGTSSLRQELDALLDTLIRVPKADHAGNSSPPGQALLRFLEANSAEPAERASLEALRRRHETGGFSGDKELLDAIARVFQARKPPPERSGVMGKLFGKGGSAGTDEKALRRRLGGLLEALDPPETLRPRLSKLKAKVADDAEEVVALFDAAASLISDLGDEYRKEQRQLGDFLAALSGKLGELEEKARGMDALNRTAAAERRAAENSVAGEVEGLRADASKATDLAQLRQMITVRLDAIAFRLDAYRNADEQRLAESQAHVEDMAYRLRTLEQEAEDLRNQLILANRVAYIDPLTKLPNRNAYLERIDLEEKRWRRFQQPLCMAVWDIDFFKKINDRFGHASGDKALAMIGAVLASGIRSTDFVARYGGEEFVMLMVGADDSNSLDLANDIRLKIENCEFTSEGRRIPITVSCGVSQFKGKDTYADVFERADQALYQAKRKGRNRCELL